MFCRQCGTQNADGVPTCTACGAQLDNPYQASGALPPQQSGGQKPENYLIQAILVTLCCCMPLGIVGIVFAAQVDSKWSGGDYGGAIESAKQARLWTLVGFGLGLLSNGVVLLLYFLAMVGAAANAGP